jgi:hypothetical protein
MTREQIIAELSKLIEVQGQYNEAECGELLKNPEASSVLIPFGASPYFIDAEIRTSAGDVDLIICANESLPGGQSRRLMYVWELKAPQHYLFYIETNGRASPTPEFYSAENQLIHYHAYLAGSEEDRRKSHILSKDDVLIGGIIIGSTQNFVDNRKLIPNDKANMLATSALEIRKRVLYKSECIGVKTWTMVLDSLREITASHTKFPESHDVGIPLDAGPAVDESTA